jgi:hypothetical protein
LIGGGRSTNFSKGKLLCPTHFLIDVGNRSLKKVFNVQEQQEDSKEVKGCVHCQQAGAIAPPWIFNIS